MKKPAVKKDQTFKGTVSKYLNLKVKWCDKQFKAIIDSGVIRNYIISKTAEQLNIPYRQKEYLYLLVIILKELVLYRDSVINLKIKLV